LAPHAAEHHRRTSSVFDHPEHAIAQSRLDGSHCTRVYGARGVVRKAISCHARPHLPTRTRRSSWLNTTTRKIIQGRSLHRHVRDRLPGIRPTFWAGDPGIPTRLRQRPVDSRHVLEPTAISSLGRRRPAGVVRIVGFRYTVNQSSRVSRELLGSRHSMRTTYSAKPPRAWPWRRSWALQQKQYC